MVQSFLRTVSLLVACLLASPLAHADEEKDPPDLGPRAKAFAAPSAAHDLAIDLVVVAGGTVVGKVHLEAKAGPLPGSGDLGKAWHVLETLVIGKDEDAEETTLDAWLDAIAKAMRAKCTLIEAASRFAHRLIISFSGPRGG